MNDMMKPALYGGPKIRPEPMPKRFALGAGERAMIDEVITHYQDKGLDPGYGGLYEQKYCDAFVEMMEEGGYATAVATGTASVYVAIAALDLPKASDILISPVTDAGPLNSIILQGFHPIVADARPDSYNSTWEDFEKVLSDNTSAIILVHAAGYPTNAEQITHEAHKRGIKVIEDASQAPGARWNGRRVGVFGDIMATSTMYRKNLMSSGSGGMVYCKDKDLYHRALACADRGKPVWQEGYDDRDPSQNLFPALNWNTDEISCAIALASVERLDDTIARRGQFVDLVTGFMGEQSKACKPIEKTGALSPFFMPVIVDETKLSCDKATFCQALQAEGIDLNYNYKFLISDWRWAEPYLSGRCDTPNTNSLRDRSFNLYLNENYQEQEAEDVIRAIVKLEQYFMV